MKAVEHLNPSEVVISILSEFDVCPTCEQVRFFVRDAGILRSICGCTADPSGPAAATERPHSPQSPLIELFAVAA
jgi:hypothetical protein